MLPFTILIIAINCLVTLYGFNKKPFYEKYLFSVHGIVKNKEFYRIFTSQFLHVDWGHLLFNMFSFYSFSLSLEKTYGIAMVAVLYFSSAIGGDILALLIQRKNIAYRAVGASGAISGIIFASIFLLPSNSIIIFPILYPMPPWLFAIIFMAASLYGIGRQSSEIGHEAHLGGALTGMLVTLTAYPQLLSKRYMLAIAVSVPTLIFLFIMIKKPGLFKKKL